MSCTKIVPSLFVTNISETLAFYEVLGFTVTGCQGDRETAEWAEVVRDEVTFQFYSDPPVGTPIAPVFSGTLYVFCENIDDLANEFRGKVEFAWGPEVMDYGMYEFAVQDPNGYFVAFTTQCL